MTTTRRRYTRGTLDVRLRAAVVVGTEPHPVLGTPCHVWIGSTDPKGYGRINSGAGRFELTHRVAWRLATGSDSPLPLMHLCDNPPCCNPAHLRPGTLAENNADMRAKGRHAFGERSASAKLRGEQAVAIRRAYAEGTSVQALAALYGVAARTVYDVLQGRTWAHVEVAS